jgi:hypothetical protein
VNTSKRLAIKGWLSAACFLLSLSAASCSLPSRSPASGSEQGAANRSANPVIEGQSADAATDWDDPCSEMFSNFFVKSDSLSFRHYKVVRLQKTVRDNEYNDDISVTYATLKTGGRTVATFDGVYFGLGNSTDFGLASVLSGNTTQLLVSQTVPRGGRHWIVDLSSDGLTVFDSNMWNLSGEDVCIHDFDDDGVAESSMAISSFWGFGAMSMAESPMTGVVLKYDATVRKYVPDKQSFADGLTNIDEDVKKIDPDERLSNGLKGPYLAVRLDIILRYVYAGRLSDAWSFFDRAYNLEDKQEMKLEIKRILESEPVYRFIYGLQPVKPRVLSM